MLLKSFYNKKNEQNNIKRQRMLVMFGIVLSLFVPMHTVGAAQNTPEWVYQDILDLAAAKMIDLPSGVNSKNVNSLTNEEVVKLTAEAIQRQKKIGKNITNVESSHEVNEGRGSINYEIQKLKTQYTEELINIGMGSEKLTKGAGASPEADGDRRNEDADWIFNGEIRYNYVKAYGAKRFEGRSSRLRSRLYLSRKLNDDWALNGMWEASKYFLSGDREDDWNSGNRLYLSGVTGITKVNAGSFGLKMAEGNIYDTYFRGVQATVDKKPWQYSFMAGRTNGSGNAAAAVARYNGDFYEVETGIHYFGEDKWESRQTTILELGTWYYVDKFRWGAMYLGSTDSSDESGQHGGVISARYRKVRSWVPGSYEIYARYYSQPQSTYRAHTMNGLGGYMTGFKGWSVGIAYALGKEILWDLEYYSLQDKVTGEDGKTIWTSITFGF